jgi:NADH-quinone oxidoreductase subunit J
VVEVFVFAVAAAVCLGGAAGVLLSKNPVHAALSLVATLFGIAVLFVAQEAHFLAAVQVIVYAGAIVVLFLFVIMFLGVDEAENLRAEPLGQGQRVAALALGGGVVALVLAALANTGFTATGTRSTVAALAPEGAADDVSILGEALLTDYVFAFEVTSILLTIAVVGAVVMSRMRTRRADEIVDAGQADREAVVETRIHEAEARATRADLATYLADDDADDTEAAVTDAEQEEAVR